MCTVQKLFTTENGSSMWTLFVQPLGVIISEPLVYIFFCAGGLGLDISMVQEASSSDETQENTTQQQKTQESQEHAK